jgi:hypothetical protein
MHGVGSVLAYISARSCSLRNEAVLAALIIKQLYYNMAPQTPTRQLGHDGPTVPALGLGLMGLSTTWYGDLLPDEERLAFLDAAVERGATFWDSARLYGDNEELVGKWFEKTGKRKEVC